MPSSAVMRSRGPTHRSASGIQNLDNCPIIIQDRLVGGGFVLPILLHRPQIGQPQPSSHFQTHRSAQHASVEDVDRQAGRGTRGRPVARTSQWGKRERVRERARLRARRRLQRYTGSQPLRGPALQYGQPRPFVRPRWRGGTRSRLYTRSVLFVRHQVPRAHRQRTTRTFLSGPCFTGPAGYEQQRRRNIFDAPCPPLRSRRAAPLGGCVPPPQASAWCGLPLPT